MSTEALERRLAAILAADLVGYGRLMEANEEDTLRTFRRHRQELLDPTVARHGGRLFKAMGDGFLVEFPSATGALRCAIDLQSGMIERNVGVPDDRQFLFRIGVNVGDVVREDDDVFGDGVNLAVRLQGLARPGGIACSAAVRDAVLNKVDAHFEDQGRKEVKNLRHPVRCFFVRWGDDEARRGSVTAAHPAKAAPFRPSVAILPFANLSSDPDQAYFSNGVTEDIITDLSNVSGLFVVSRNTVYAYKSRNPGLESPARALGVAYVVEGSVRRSGNKVRINAELIDGESDTHLWAARYDRDLTDIFEVQDEIAKTIVGQLKVKLLPDERRAIEREPTESIEAYTHYLRGREYYHIASKANHLMAKQSFLRAVELDPNYARAYAGVAVCDVRLNSSYGLDIPISQIIATADRAIELDPTLAEAYAARAFATSLAKDRQCARADFEKALALDPDCHEANRYFGEYSVTEGEFRLAAKHLARALEIKPTDYGAAVMLVSVFRSLQEPDAATGYARVAIKKSEEEMARHPENANCACLVATVLAYTGEREKAMQWLAKSLSIDPDDANVQYNAACTYSILGEADRAADLLEAWIGAVGHEMRLWFVHDSDFDSIKDHPRYQALVERVTK